MRLIVRGCWLLWLLYRTNVSDAFSSCGTSTTTTTSRPRYRQQQRKQEEGQVVGGGLGMTTRPTQTRRKRNSPVFATVVSSPPESSSSYVTPPSSTSNTTPRRTWTTDTTWNPNMKENKNVNPFDETDDALAMLIENWELEHDYMAANQFEPSQSRFEKVLGNYYIDNDDFPTKPALRLVHTIAKLMSKGKKSEDLEDEFIQEGIVALLQAMHHYPRIVAAAAAAATSSTTIKTTTSPTDLTSTTQTTNHIPLSFDEYAARHIVLEMTRQAPPDVVAAAATAAATMASNRSQLSRRTNVTKEMVVPERPRMLQGILANDHEWYDKRHAMMMENINLQWEEDEEDDDDDDDEPIWLNPHSYHPPPRTTTASTTTTRATTTTTVRDSILTVVDRDELTPEDEVLEAMIRSDVQTACREILNDVEFQVIRMHFGLEGEQRALSWREMAKRLKTTKEFVRSISEQAMVKLRRPGASRSIEPYREG